MDVLDIPYMLFVLWKRLTEKIKKESFNILIRLNFFYYVDILLCVCVREIIDLCPSGSHLFCFPSRSNMNQEKRMFYNKARKKQHSFNSTMSNIFSLVFFDFCSLSWVCSSSLTVHV